MIPYMLLLCNGIKLYYLLFPKEGIVRKIFLFADTASIPLSIVYRVRMKLNRKDYWRRTYEWL